mmetsp:Transcript_2388/g.7796  ORF Transcript_2388/g.7796 Transcript_2388/m.7796 type:complete len:249 (+) Transcript_2388:50-796(+)
MKSLRGAPIALLLLSSAALLFADEEIDVDRTDFSDPALSAELEAEGPSEHVESAALLPDAIDDKVEIGANNTLLIALSNLGGKMYNVTHVDGHLEELGSGKQLGKFRRQSFGEPLGPREQRSFRYLFVPPLSIKPDAYRLVFSIYYQNRDAAKFVDAIFNETASLVPATDLGIDADMMLLAGGAAAGAAMLFAIGYLLSSGSGAPPAKAKKAAASAKASGNGEASEWLQGTAAGSEGKPRSGRSKKRS